MHGLCLKKGESERKSIRKIVSRVGLGVLMRVSLGFMEGKEKGTARDGF